jgi:hypothetical protein
VETEITIAEPPSSTGPGPKYVPEMVAEHWPNGYPRPAAHRLAGLGDPRRRALDRGGAGRSGVLEPVRVQQRGRHGDRYTSALDGQVKAFPTTQFTALHTLALVTPHLGAARDRFAQVEDTIGDTLPEDEQCKRDLITEAQAHGHRIDPNQVVYIDKDAAAASSGSKKAA